MITERYLKVDAIVLDPITERRLSTTMQFSGRCVQVTNLLQISRMMWLY